MGFPKALLPFGPDTFLTRILSIVRKVGLMEPTVVLGKAASIIEKHIHNEPVHIWINPNPEKGQLSSLQLALSLLPMQAEACLIWPVDHPAVSENLVRALVELYVASDSLIACPVYEGKRGHPAIFHRTIFCEFMEAPLEEGPKTILSRYLDYTIVLHTAESGVVLDIDTPADYLALTGRSLKEALAGSNISDPLQS